MRPGAAADLERLIARFRRRLTVASFTRTALFTTALCAGALALINVLAAPTVPTRIILGVSSLLAALVTSVAVAYARRPTSASTAATLDDRLRLQNHLAAALAAARERDAVATLVVRDAARRLHGVAPRDVISFDAGRHGVACLVMVGAALLTTFGLERSTAAGVDRGGGIAMSAGGGAAALVPASASLVEGIPDSSATGRSREAGSPVVAPLDADEPSTAAAPPRSGPAVPSPEPTTVANRMAAAETPSNRDRFDDHAPMPKQARGDAFGAAEARAAQATAGARGPGGFEAGLATSGGGGRFAAGTRTGAGGVGREPLGAQRADDLPPDAIGAARPALTTTGASAAARARAVSQALGVVDDLPPGRRHYVREYFLRLQKDLSR